MDLKKYDIIYADPPWFYRGRKQFGFAGDVVVDTGGAIKHYLTMTKKEIANLPIQKISKENALLFIWIPGPILLDGIDVIKVWGFEYKRDAFQWDKQRTNPGYYTLSQIETCYVAKRGKIPQPRGSRNERQFHSELRGEHSAKPTEIRDRITKMFPTQDKIELFAREVADGWDAVGYEIDGRDIRDVLREV